LAGTRESEALRCGWPGPLAQSVTWGHLGEVISPGALVADPNPVVTRLAAGLAERYRIERELGQGGMATVYLAEDLKHHRKVAIKVLRPELASTLGPERFLREVELAAQLTHPHILPLHDSGEVDGFLFYVMPYIEGESLRERLAREGRLPINDTIRIVREVVDALTSAHRLGIVHRDVKPDNVMLSQHHAMVTDFGVAKAVSEAASREQLTTVGVALGTPTYMAPEQAAADATIDHRADIYAVGVLAYELLAGQPPFTGATSQMVLGAHLATPPRPLTEHRPSVPPDLASVVMRCLEKDRADRWQTAEELFGHLEALSTPSGAVTPTQTVPARAIGSGWRRAVGVGGAVLVLVALGAYLLGPFREARSDLIETLLLVTPFENQTGDTSLDPIGRVLADMLAREIETTGLVEVVDADAALAGIVVPAGAGRAGEDLALASGAGTIVRGAYFLRGDSVQIQASMVSAESGTLLAGIDPVMVPLADPLLGGGILVDRVLGAVAFHFGERGTALQASRPPPSYEVYRRFRLGVETQRDGRYAQGVPHFQQALALDSTFYPAAIYLAMMYASAPPANSTVIDVMALDSVVRWLAARREQLSPFERHWVDHYEAYLQGDPVRSYQAHQALLALRPNDPFTKHMAGLYTLRIGRVREAVEIWTRPHQMETSPYWNRLTVAYHLLGDHEAELAAALAGREAVRNDQTSLLRRIRALIGLGRVDEVRGMVEDVLNFPRGLAGETLNEAANEFRIHGFPDAAQEFNQRALEWCRRRLEAAPMDVALRRVYGQALGQAGVNDSAAAVFSALYAETGNIFILGLAGVHHAWAGHRARAEDIDRQLADLKTPFLRGSHTRQRGLIQAALGNRERAVDLLSEAFQQGSYYELWVHTHPAVDSLRGYPRWEEFARPR